MDVKSTEFEKKAIGLLTAGKLDESIRNALFGRVWDLCGYNASGYFVAARHDELPARRIVCDDPVTVGFAGDITVGFVAFIEGQEITLDCYDWGPK